jgi:CheY-like chemotaxis protein
MVVLYVDDDPEDIEIFVEAVNAIDPSIKCLAAKNGKLAMDILHADLVPDFVFLDINMPVINGRVLLAEIRTEKKFRDIPVIMYSTAMDSHEIEEYKAMGANQFLIKRNQFQDLCDAISKILGR